MQSRYTTSHWGYEILGGNKIKFFHIILPRLTRQKISFSLPGVESMEIDEDGSILLSPYPWLNTKDVMNGIISFFERKSLDYLDTNYANYRVSKEAKEILRQWFLAFEGCLGILLSLDKRIQALRGNFQWKFINAKTGGLYLAPYTLFLYKDYAKIIHPVTVSTIDDRFLIEKTAAHFVQLLAQRVQDAQKGYEGMAMLSVVEERTQLQRKNILKAINDKSFYIVNPSNSPFFEI